MDITEISANIEWVLNSIPIVQLNGSEFFKSDIDLITQVDNFFKCIGNKVEREDFGIIDLTRRGIKNSMAHGIGRIKAIAFAAVPDVIKYGKIIDHQINWKGRGYDTFVICAPVKIENDDYIAEVIIEQNKSSKNEFYLHEVELKEKAQSAFKTATERSALQASLERTKSTFTVPQVSRLIITQKINEIKNKLTIDRDFN